MYMFSSLKTAIFGGKKQNAVLSPQENFSSPACGNEFVDSPEKENLHPHEEQHCQNIDKPFQTPSTEYQTDADMAEAEAEADNQLWLAASSGDTDLVRSLACDGANVDYLAECGSSCCFMAATNGHADTITALYRLGANVNLPGPLGATPLSVALQNDFSDVADALIKAGADASSQTPTKVKTSQVVVADGKSAKTPIGFLASGAINSTRMPSFSPKRSAESPLVERALVERVPKSAVKEVLAKLTTPSKPLSSTSGSPPSSSSGKAPSDIVAELRAARSRAATPVKAAPVAVEEKEDVEEEEEVEDVPAVKRSSRKKVAAVVVEEKPAKKTKRATRAKAVVQEVAVETPEPEEKEEEVVAPKRSTRKPKAAPVVVEEVVAPKRSTRKAAPVVVEEEEEVVAPKRSSRKAAPVVVEKEEPEQAATFTEKQLNKLKITELRAELKKAGKDCFGAKAALIARLLAE